MAETKRFVVVDHYVVDTKRKKHAPFGEKAGARDVCDRLNNDTIAADAFAWVDGTPEKGRARETEP